MKIVVLSDTHMPRMAKALPDPLINELRTADFIVHAGDWTRPEIADRLREFAPLDGVAGNNDGPAIVYEFGLKKVLQLGGLRFGLVHGHEGVGGRTGTEARALQSFKGEEIRGVIYGHSHIPVLKEENGLLVFNPGSPTDKRKQPYYSFGILEIEGVQVRAKHVFYKNK